MPVSHHSVPSDAEHNRLADPKRPANGLFASGEGFEPRLLHGKQSVGEELVTTAGK